MVVSTTPNIIYNFSLVRCKDGFDTVLSKKLGGLIEYKFPLNINENASSGALYLVM